MTLEGLRYAVEKLIALNGSDTPVYVSTSDEEMHGLWNIDSFVVTEEDAVVPVGTRVVTLEDERFSEPSYAEKAKASARQRKAKKGGQER